MIDLVILVGAYFCIADVRDWWCTLKADTAREAKASADFWATYQKEAQEHEAATAIAEATDAVAFRRFMDIYEAPRA